MRFNLVVIGQPASPDATPGSGELLRAHAVADDPHNTGELARAGIPVPAFFLLRPDGHVALAGARLESGAVARYFLEHRIAA
jgi:hypothetical protein